MQIDELLPPSATARYPVLQPDDPYVADLLQLADGRWAFLATDGTDGQHRSHVKRRNCCFAEYTSCKKTS